jgi:hypothetical protein
VGISVLDRKMLWGRSGMRCAICQVLLSEERDLGGAVIIGEEAHIVAHSLNGPRGNSPLSEEARNHYSNLILLCPTDHARIDNLPDEYPVERLKSIKAQHEATVTTSDAFDRQYQLAEENWARLIDQLDERIPWRTWQFDVSAFFDPNSPWVNDSFTDKLDHVSQWIYSRFWPGGHESLKTAIEQFGQLLSDWVNKFSEHSESPLPDSKKSATARFYKIDNWNPDQYFKLLTEYKEHVRLLEDLALEATRYCNYIASLIRKEIDPSYRFDEGLLLIQAPTEMLQYVLLRPQFRSSDFDDGEPYKDLETFKIERSRREICTKTLES